MNVLYSFLAASTLSAFDLGVLALAVAGLGGDYGRGRLALLTLAVLLKAAFLAGGLYWLGKQTWSSRPALLAGVAAPFLFFIAWQMFKLQFAPRAGRLGKES